MNTKRDKNHAVIPFQPEVRLAVLRLRHLAENETGKIYWKPDAKKQMADRKINIRDAFRVLKNGEIWRLHHVNRNGEVEVCVCYKPAGMSQMAVAVAVTMPNGAIEIRSVMWKSETLSWRNEL